MYRKSGNEYALRKSKQTLLEEMDKNKIKSEQLAKANQRIEELEETIEKLATERDAYRNQNIAIKLMAKSLKEEE